ncbi:HSP20-like chaperone [Rhypophila sp. PSN 637]
MNALGDHPFARGLREHWSDMQRRRQRQRDCTAATRPTADHNHGEEQVTTEHDNDVDGGIFVPPVDIFNTANNWTLHVSVPGAKKEDVNVHWDADRSTLAISGLVYRPGDEEFLNTLVAAERRVGLFERKVQLPPPGGVSRDEDGEKEEVDADNITARMEDGILVVVVPKVEKEWTEVKKVDIE